jgi:hypothetical protein
MPVIIDGTNGITQAGEFNSDSSFGFKNRIINGQMVLDQRNAGASVTPVSNQYLVDRFWYGSTQASKFTAQQNAGSVTPPAGFVNYLGMTVASAVSIGAGDAFYISQYIEGYNVSDLGFGSANAKTVTLSFQVYSSLTGTFGGALKNSNSTRNYPFTYTISTANTWTTISVTIAGDTSGTWGNTNGVGIQVVWGLGVGSTFSATAGAWTATNAYSSTGAVSVVGTNGATFYITGVQLEVGSTATSFDYRPYGTELALCQRYYYQVAAGSSAYTQFGAGRAFSTTGGNGIVQFPMPMRTAPTFAFLGSVGNYDFSPTAIASGAVPSSNTHMTVGMTFSSITSGSMFWLGQNASSTPCGFTFSAEL